MGATPPFRLIDLVGDDRERALPILKESFEGIYRWHAKRTMRDIPVFRAVEADGVVVGASMLDRLTPEVGYLYYVFVGRDHRRRGIAGTLLDDALGRFRSEEVRVVYAAAEEENAASRGLFRSRGFREVERKEPGWLEGGLGAWGLRTRMRLVSGEVLMGLRLDPSLAEPRPVAPPDTRGATG
ncbi:MAG TPA: GNAT family N-acetyltransferase [Thermoplasmata archaeon]|nr:GNAT family N-acetyltransferase [Thermoplasmata archaeon]